MPALLESMQVGRCLHPSHRVRNIGKHPIPGAVHLAHGNAQRRELAYLPEPLSRRADPGIGQRARASAVRKGSCTASASLLSFAGSASPCRMIDSRPEGLVIFSRSSGAAQARTNSFTASENSEYTRVL
jgi:hypothetical protein